MLRLNRTERPQACLNESLRFASKLRKLWAGIRADQGSALVEFAVVLPLLMTLVLGIVTFGTAFGTYQTLTNAAAAGAQALAVARGQTSDPCITASGPVFTLAHYLNQANIKFTITVAPQTGQTGTTYNFASGTASPSCTANSTNLLQNDNVTVKLTYPCQLSIYGVNFAPSCTMTAQTWEVIQ